MSGEACPVPAACRYCRDSTGMLVAGGFYPEDDAPWLAVYCAQCKSSQALDALRPRR